MRTPTIDLNHYFTKGYCKTFVPNPLYDEFFQIIKNINWVDDPDKIYRRIPDWNLKVQHLSAGSKSDKERYLAKQSLTLPPPDLIRILEELINTECIVGPFLQTYKLKLDFVDIWDGVESTLGWHWDGPAQSDVVSLIYFNDMVWPDHRGGGLAVGERDILPNSQWLIDYDNVIEHERIKPSGRTQAWVNNANPRFVHKPLTLNDTNDQRITLTFGLSLTQK